MDGRIGAMIAAFLSTMSAPAAAQFGVDEVRAGVLSQSCCGEGSNKEQGVSINVEAVFNSPKVLSFAGAPRPFLGASIASDSDATSQAYGGLEWRVEFARRLFAAANVGAAVHNGETDAYDPVADAERSTDTVFYGCRVLFRFGGDVGVSITDRVRASLHYNHASNAGLCADNEGLDHLGARLGLQF